MKDVARKSSDRQVVREEFLTHLEEFDKGNWQVLGWSHMHLKDVKWLQEPQKLKDCPFSRMFKNWLLNDDTPIPRKTTLELELGLDQSVDSVYFSFYLAKGKEICIVSYAEHKFDNKYFEDGFNRAEYSLVFKDWKKPILGFLRAKGGADNGREAI